MPNRVSKHQALAQLCSGHVRRDTDKSERAEVQESLHTAVVQHTTYIRLQDLTLPWLCEFVGAVEILFLFLFLYTSSPDTLYVTDDGISNDIDMIFRSKGGSD
jgi:hypothetical protein